LAVLIAGAGALVFGLVGPVAAQSIPGPLKVTDSGPSGSPGYAIKGITGFANDAGVFGYGTVASSAINIDGVVGYVQTPQSVGVVGWSSSTGTSAYGMFGHSDTGPGVFGFNANGAAASILGQNSSSGGIAVFGSSTGGNGVQGDSAAANGVVGTTETGNALGGFAGIAGSDNSTAGANFGVAGATSSVVGSAVFGNAVNGGTGAILQSDSGFGAIASSTSGTAMEVFGGLLTSGFALVGVASGEGVISEGFSGTANDPALIGYDAVGGTDLFGTFGFNGGGTPNETFIVQSGTADASGAAPAGSSDTQVSGDLYVGGTVYAGCSAGGVFPATAGSCADIGPDVKLRAGAAAVTTYRPRESIPTMEDFGEATLANGQAVIPLERTFAQTIDPSRSYLVFITSESENRGLYVTSKTPSGFVVREMNGGRSTGAFEYRIVAHPRGSTAVRLATVAGSAPHVAMRLGRFGNAGAMKTAALHKRAQGLRFGRTPARLPMPTVNLSPK
jgi:hypothetical protein